MTVESTQSQSFRIEKHGDIAVIIPSTEVESMPENLIQQAAQMVLAPLRADPARDSGFRSGNASWRDALS